MWACRKPPLQVRAKLEMLNKQYKAAEAILVENGRADEAIEMYKEMHRWDEAVGVAEMANHSDLENLKRHHYQWLMETGQEEQVRPRAVRVVWR